MSASVGKRLNVVSEVVPRVASWAPKPPPDTCSKMSSSCDICHVSKAYVTIYDDSIHACALQCATQVTSTTSKSTTQGVVAQHDVGQSHVLDESSLLADKGQNRMLQRHQGGLLDKMRTQLHGGRFRMLNEQLYSVSGADAFLLMQVSSCFTTR
jgi:hypothetical protein